MNIPTSIATYILDITNKVYSMGDFVFHHRAPNYSAKIIYPFGPKLITYYWRDRII